MAVERQKFLVLLQINLPVMKCFDKQIYYIKKMKKSVLKVITFFLEDDKRIIITFIRETKNFT